MASDNNQDEWKKSVEGVIGHVQLFLDADPTKNFTPSFVAGMLNRFRDAHNREVEELRECLRIIRDNLLSHTIKSEDGKYVNNGGFLSEEFVDDERWRKAIKGEASAGDGTTSVVPDSDMRLAHYYLSMHRGMLENMRLGYMKRFEDSGREFTNERAKADYCQCDINTVDGWLERHKDHRVDESKVNHLNGDYSTKKVIKF